MSHTPHPFSTVKFKSRAKADDFKMPKPEDKGPIPDFEDYQARVEAVTDGLVELRKRLLSEVKELQALKDSDPEKFVERLRTQYREVKLVAESVTLMNLGASDEY